MSTPIPTVPINQNPYLVYLAVLRQSFGTTPGLAARRRVLILIGLNSLALFLGLVYLGLLIFDAKKRKVPGSLWLFRLIQRPSGRYVVTNRNLWSGILGVITSGVIIARLLAYWYGFLLNGSQAGAGALGAFTVIPIFLHVYVTSCANFQSYMMLPERYDRHLVSARTANAIYIGGGTLFTLGLLGASTAIAVKADKAWYLYLDLFSVLNERAIAWNGEAITIVDLLTLQPYLVATTRAVTLYRSAIVAGAGLLCFAPFCSALINIASIALARVLRTQINIDLEALRNPESGFSGFSKFSGSTTMSGLTDLSGLTEVNYTPESSSEGGAGETTEKLDEKVFEGKISRREVRRIAKGGADSGMGSEQAKHIVMLQKAERDLLLIAIFMFFVTISSLILLLWTTVAWGRSSSELNMWSPVTTEICLFGIFWIYSCTVSLTLMCLIYNTVVHMIPSSVPQPI